MFSTITLVIHEKVYQRLPEPSRKVLRDSAVEAIDNINWDISYPAEQAADVSGPHGRVAVLKGVVGQDVDVGLLPPVPRVALLRDHQA
jgi:hypothetical protein